MFIHLNCHSNYSLLSGADTIDHLVQAAAQMGCSSLALTDTHALYGAVAFYRLAKSCGVHPILGTEITDTTQAKKTGEPASPTRRAVLLAKDLKGFGEICRIITDCGLNPDFSFTESLQNVSDRVIILSPDENVLHQVCKARGGENIYAELTRFPGIAENRGLLDFAHSNRLPILASNRVFFIHQKDWQVHRLLSAIRTRTTVHTLPPGATVAPDCWMKPPQEMQRLFQDLPDAILNTRKVAECCDVSLPIGEVLFPKFDLPAGETQASYLEKLALKGARKLYPGLPETVIRRLRYELGVIDKLSFATYFLIVWDIVREAKARGILTVGRGSAANSLVCRVLKITDVDPIQHNLYFERFLNPERTDYPDIDIDFPWNRRDEMLDYVFEKYGHENVALISAHVHFRCRSVLREVGKAIGIPIAEIDAFTKKLPHAIDLSRLAEAREAIPECRDLPLEDEPHRTLIALGKRIHGFPRHLSIHCGGIVVSPFPITDRVPLQKTPKGFVVTQYDMYPAEDMGFLKIDLLAQKGLAVLADTIQDVKTHYEREVDFNSTNPTQDPKTRELIRRGDTIGCFYIESPGMRNLLKKLKVQSFDMLTAASSIIRPGIADSGMMKAFIDRHNGREKVRSLHPKMGELLKDTFGVMIYQEDVIKVAHEIAGMSLGEADSLRKCMSKKRDWEDINTYRERFLKGTEKNGVQPSVGLEIWRQIESFAGYAFCKAHSASFAIVSYQTAYLKAHYPAEFMAAVLSNHGGFYDTCAYVEEARRMGLRILLPDINRSEEAFTTTFCPGAGKTTRGNPGTKKSNAIRVGLAQVKGLTHHALRSILENRGEAFTSLGDFLSRVKITGHEVETLIRSGACDGWGKTRPELLWQLKLFSRVLHAKDNPRIYLHGSLFENKIRTDLVPGLPEYGLREKLLAELECLDLTVSDHLLSLYDIDSDRQVPAKKLAALAGRVVTLTGWLIHSKRTRTVKNEIMKFLMLEDRTATFEVTLFPAVYRRFGPLLYDRGPYTVTGRVERDGNCCTLTAFRLSRNEKQP